MTTKTLVIGAIAVAVAVTIVPALKGPYNRVKNTANEKLNEEFLVDNYKAEYIKLHEKRAQVLDNLNRFQVEKKVAEKKAVHAATQVGIAKKRLLNVGTSDLREFNRAKDAYEAANVELNNLNAMSSVYSNAITKLTTSLQLIETNMRKAKMNVDMLSSKKDFVDSVKGVNKTIESLKGVGEDELSIPIEKLDEDALRETIKLEALAEASMPAATTTEAEAKAYLDSLR